MVLVLLALVSGASFLHYGFQILVRPRMQEEFTRYGLPELRRFVGALEVLGAVGVLLGLAFAPIGALAAAGLTLLMALGLLIRIRIRDEPRLMVPAASLGAVNAVLVVLFLSS